MTKAQRILAFYYGLDFDHAYLDDDLADLVAELRAGRHAVAVRSAGRGEFGGAAAR